MHVESVHEIQINTCHKTTYQSTTCGFTLHITEFTQVVHLVQPWNHGTVIDTNIAAIVNLEISTA